MSSFNLKVINESSSNSLLRLFVPFVHSSVSLSSISPPAPPRMSMVSIHDVNDLCSLPLNKWRIPEPSSSSIPSRQLAHLLPSNSRLMVLVPGLAFDGSGGRLGRGAGLYDEWLQAHAGRNPEKSVEGHRRCMLVGVCLDEQIVNEVPREAHDATVDLILTQSRVIHCK